MSEPFLAEIMIFGFNFAPRGWAQCDGQILPINQNQSLYSLLGTTYGGDGRTSFALPELRGRTPIHEGTGIAGLDFVLGQKSGEETVALKVEEIPVHDHILKASSDDGDSPVSTGNLLAKATNIYRDPDALTPLQPQTVSSTGGQAHENMMPYTTLNYCIALSGTFPSRN